MKRLKKEFFKNSAEIVAQNLIGKTLCANCEGKIVKSMITEVEVYLGENDTASHARFGQNSKASSMWDEGGTIWVYLCYGMHNMLNITTGEKGDPQAVLIRGTENANGPGKVTKMFEVTKEDCLSKIYSGGRLWICKRG